MIYTQLVRFLLPLVIVVIVQELSLQVLNGGMARVPQATETLASYGLAWGLVAFLTSSALQARQLGLVLVDGRSAYRKVRLFVIGFGLLLAGIVASLALSPFGVFVIEGVHGIGEPLSSTALGALFWLIPIPLLFGLNRFYSGLLIRIRRTDIVSYAMLSNIGLSVLAVFVLLPTEFVQVQPIRLPLVVTYAGLLIELCFILAGYWRYGRPTLSDTDSGLSYLHIFRFFWPLAVIMALQGFSRPLINLFISREPNGAEALAVLTVVYALGHMPYGWLNENRSLATAFQEKKHSLVYIRRFIAGCGLLSFGVMVILFWTPLRDYILETLIGLGPDLAAMAVTPLLIFSFFPLPVAIRSYYHGLGLLERRTKSMAPSAPARIGAILAALIVLPFLGVYGATLGVAALYCGFLAETALVWWGIRGRQQHHKLKPKLLFNRLLKKV